MNVVFLPNITVASPGLPGRGWDVGGALTPGEGGANLLFGKTFSRKLLKNERNWTERAYTSLAPALGSG